MDWNGESAFAATARESGRLQQQSCRYSLAPLCAPMLVGGTGRPCEKLDLVPGSTYTIGRSLSCCDLVFQDSRVSRKHCRVVLDASGANLLLLEGAGAVAGAGAGAAAATARSSRNGIFVDGHKLAPGAVQILCPGSVVSLVACTEGNQVLDPNFGLAIGFVVVDATTKAPHNHHSNVVSSRPNKRKKAAQAGSDAKEHAQEQREAGGDGQTSLLNQTARTRNFPNHTPGTSSQPSEEHAGHGLAGKLGDDTPTEPVATYSLVVSTGQDGAQSCQETPLDNLAIEHNLEQLRTSIKPQPRFGHSHPPLLPGVSFNTLAGADGTGGCRTVSLSELLSPLDDLLALFAATFTGDIEWFLSSHDIPKHLPVTIACHDEVRSWSLASIDRLATPLPEWPNLTVIYPPFPSVCAMGKDQLGNRRGFGCHHPKLFLLQKRSSLRVIITSANLTPSQWANVTNNVWWQDFPVLPVPTYDNLFFPRGGYGEATGDFSAQLASFVAALLVDVPSQVQWVMDLASYDFSKAETTLIASVPGLHGCPYDILPTPVGDVQNDLTPEQALGVVDTMISGISYRFHAACDPKGARLRELAAVLQHQKLEEPGVIRVCLRRIRNIAADPSAVGIFIPAENTARGPLLSLHKDQSDKAVSSPLSLSNDTIQVGFLPRDTAKWVAHLCDTGACIFAACVSPKDVLAVACGQMSSHARVTLYVYKSAQFSEVLEHCQTFETQAAICCLLRSLQRPLGLWRLQQVLSKFEWPCSGETDFVYGSSSIGTSVDVKFLAAFAAAVGRRAAPYTDSNSADSDPEWGCWTVEHEANDPSIGIIFPTIERAKGARGGVRSHCGLHHFAQRTWERLQPTGMLHDAVPCSAERTGYPMHVKVAMRRFQNHPSEPSYGWVYYGSHNFSPAAWGRPLFKPVQNHKASSFASVQALGCSLLLSNYELGVLFIVPPPAYGNASPIIGGCNWVPQQLWSSLDKFPLPFVTPAPRYGPTDKPATGKELKEAILECQVEEEDSGGGAVEDGTEVSSSQDAVPEESEWFEVEMWSVGDTKVDLSCKDNDE